MKLHAEWIEADPDLDFLTGDYEYRDESGRLIGTSLAQHDAGRMMIARAEGGSRIVMDRPEEVRAYVGDHFGDTHTLSVPVTLERSGPRGIARGNFALPRLDYGIGEGEWADAGLVAHDVPVRFRIVLDGFAAPGSAP